MFPPPAITAEDVAVVGSTGEVTDPPGLSVPELDGVVTVTAGWCVNTGPDFFLLLGVWRSEQIREIEKWLIRNYFIFGKPSQPFVALLMHAPPVGHRRDHPSLSYTIPSFDIF
jgi:hypothetical protein